jgi:nucleoside-diphosphate-sugar epimerase
LKALVTGATGFIGSHLVELLLKKKYDVRIMLRRTSDTVWLKGLPVEKVYGDLFDAEALRNAVSGVDYVYHSAGVTKAKDKKEYFRGNTEGTKNILDAVKAYNPGIRRFVQISSQAAVGPSPSRSPIDETVEAHPITTYGVSKWQAEEACRDALGSVPVTIVRPPAVFGPRDKDVYEFFNTMTKGLQPMVGLGEKYVSLIHVGDLVRGFVMAAESEKAKGETYFISSKEMYGWKEVGDVTRRILEKYAFRLKIPEFGVYVIATFAEFFSLFSSKPALINYEKARDMVQDYWTCTSAKALRDFGYQQEISLEDGIRDTVAWYKSHGWL